MDAEVAAALVGVLAAMVTAVFSLAQSRTTASRQAASEERLAQMEHRSALQLKAVDSEAGRQAFVRQLRVEMIASLDDSLEAARRLVVRRIHDPDMSDTMGRALQDQYDRSDRELRTRIAELGQLESQRDVVDALVKARSTIRAFADSSPRTGTGPTLDDAAEAVAEYEAVLREPPANAG